MKLLKTSFFILFFALIANSVNAQGWGVRAGANFSTVNDSYADTQIGAYAGVFKEIGIVPKLLYIQPEVQFSKQGFDTNTANIDLSYIQVPIVAKVYLLKIISLETGPQFGFLVSDKTDGPTKPNFSSFDPSWAFGLNFNLPLGLSIGGRYITSFNDVSDNSGYKNQVIQVGAAFRF